MPPQRAPRGRVPPPLRLEHEQRAADHEPRAPDDLRAPVHAVLEPRVRPRDDAGQRGEARYPEDRGAEELGEAREEAEFAQVVGRELVPRGEPDPVLLGGAVPRFVLLRLRVDAGSGRGSRGAGPAVRGGSSPDEVLFVRVVVPAASRVWHEPHRCAALSLEHLFQRPSEAPCPVLVDGLHHQQNAPNLEDSRADERRDASPVCNLGAKLGRGSDEGEEDKAAVDHPDHTAERERDRNEPRYIPVRILRTHLPDPSGHRVHGGCGFGGKRVGGLRGGGGFHVECVAAFAVVAGTPLEVYVMYELFVVLFVAAQMVEVGSCWIEAAERAGYERRLVEELREVLVGVMLSKL